MKKFIKRSIQLYLLAVIVHVGLKHTAAAFK